MRKQAWNSLAVVVLVSAVAMMSGCMTVSDNQTLVQSTNSGQTFNNRKIAVLPVKTQTSLAPDSVGALRTEVSKRLGKALKAKLPSANVSDLPIVVGQLNDKNALTTHEQLLVTYENTGVIDKRHAATLGRTLGAEFLLLSRLKAEKLDIVISRGMGTSLELMLINTGNGEVVWGGSGEWKRGGIFGAGKASPDDAAERLVELAFSSLQ